ncbi:MAG: ABC transporter permease [Deltaproteobacteria bacterium]|jgi:peptide/nickel transport system permease protein
MNLNETTVTKDFHLEEPLAPKQTRLEEFWLLFGQNRLAIMGLLIFILFFCCAIAGLFLTSGSKPIFDPSLIRLEEKLRPPFSKPNLDLLEPNQVPTLNFYLMGTDDLGRDVFARMLQGAWVSLTVGFVAVGISVLIGIFMGGIAGYFGQHYIKIDHILWTLFLVSGTGLVLLDVTLSGAALLLLCLAYIVYVVLTRHRSRKKAHSSWRAMLHTNAVSVDTLIMRIVDIMLCFPSFFLILTVVAILPASIYNIMIVIGLTSWMGTTRFVRAEFLSLREQDFVAAAKALGIGNFRIIFRHMMPNAVAPVLVSATIGIASAILTEAGLSFLGFGVPPPNATWGNILSGGKNFIFDAPWLTFIPGITILIVVLSFNLFGEGLRDALNPKLRERH